MVDARLGSKYASAYALYKINQHATFKDFHDPYFAFFLFVIYTHQIFIIRFVFPMGPIGT